MAMDHISFILKLCLSFHILLLHWSGSSATTYGNGNGNGNGNETDLLALLDFKNGITHDPHRVMSSWNDSVHFCKWVGVTCNTSTQRVVRLFLAKSELVGLISPSLGNLTFLKRLNLSVNNFHSKIPAELGRLSQLQHLTLRNNFFEGMIPVNLTRCLNLLSIDLIRNNLTGDIPYHIGNLKNLKILWFDVNRLTGIIPPSIANCTSLESLSLSRNGFHGNIPNELGQLPTLQRFDVFSNNLTGLVPPSLYNLSMLYYISVVFNQLHGSLPSDIGLTLPVIEIFAVGLNHFHGTIPESLSNATNLWILEFSQNAFTGLVPMSFGKLPFLFMLNFGTNHLGSGKSDDLNFITSLVNCTSLSVLGADSNHLQGQLPDSIGNLSSSLDILTLGGNLINGCIPQGIENLLNLTLLGIEDNFLTGIIPSGIGKLRNLGKLYLNDNRLSGRIPSTLGALTLLISLDMQQNRLEGSIPPELGNCHNLLSLNISSNNLTGTIPKQILSLSSLSICLSVAHNSLGGSLPLEVGSLTNLETLDISGNQLSGEIPFTLGKCGSLQHLNMGGNLFQGSIPMSLKVLRGLEELDLSHNNLSGQVPDFLSSFPSLQRLDLSVNDLEGKVPEEGIFKNASAVILRGNKKLCGGITKLDLPLCKPQAHRKSIKFFSSGVTATIIIGVLLLFLLSFLATLYWLRILIKRSRVRYTSSMISILRTSFSDIFKSTDGFSSECLIGAGSFGSVYKGVLSGGKIYAIKVLNLQTRGASKCFTTECEVLRNIRHRNLIEVVTVVASVDYDGGDFKALVYEFMPNGSLNEWLHQSTRTQPPLQILNLVQRLNIAIDVGFGLEYLHCYCETPIVHCDLKPSNILLDEDFVAHIGDFGLAKILFETSNSISSGLKGSIGYIPPEYGTGGQVSILGDVYSYGILLLEMFTGKRPTDEMFKDGLSIYDFVRMALPDNVLDIVDAFLLFKEDDKHDADGESGNVIESEKAGTLSRGAMERRKGECLLSVIRIALSCCVPIPTDRPEVSVVVKEMVSVRDWFCRSS